MKKVLLGGLFVVGALFSNAQDMSVEKIIDTYLENIGGKEALNDIEGYKMNASISVQGMDLPIEGYTMKDGRMIIKFELQGKEMVQEAYDGNTKWGVNFMTMKAEKSESEETENYRKTIGEFPDLFLNYEKLGYEVELDGEDTKDGVECYKLKVTKDPQMVDGEEKDDIVYYFMDKENMVPIMTETEIMGGQMAGQVVQTLFSDFQEVDGVYFPFSITYQTEMGGQTIVVESMELDPEVEDAMFAFPEEEVESAE